VDGDEKEIKEITNDKVVELISGSSIYYNKVLIYLYSKCVMINFSFICFD
jgi:hypothetical protein